MKRSQTRLRRLLQTGTGTLLALSTLTVGLPAAGDARSSVAVTPEEYEFGHCRLWVASLKRCVTVDNAIPPPDHRTRRQPDFDGLRRDTYYFFGLQSAMIALLYIMPEDLSGWTDEQKEQRRFSKWWKNVNNPTWDDDEDWINYVAHPYWGAAYYVRARERGYGNYQAFGYSALLSTLYEFGLEAMFEPVSIQDFFVTPIAGSWLGTWFWEWRNTTRQRINRTDQARFRDKAVLVGTDPLGAMNRFVDRRLGRGIEFHAMPFKTIRQGFENSDRRVIVWGVTFTLRW